MTPGQSSSQITSNYLPTEEPKRQLKLSIVSSINEEELEQDASDTYTSGSDRQTEFQKRVTYKKLKDQYNKFKKDGKRALTYSIDDFDDSSNTFKGYNNFNAQAADVPTFYIDKSEPKKKK